MDEKEYLSKEKHDELVKELDHLRSDVRREVLDDLEYAKQLGDLSENAEYHEARKRQADLEERIDVLEVLLRNATIVSHKDGDTVSIGSMVVVEKKGGDEKKFEIVGTEEAEAGKGKLSNRSPLGSQLLGKKKGDVVQLKTPNGVVAYTVVSVK